MSFFSKEQVVVGIEQNANHLKIASLRKKKDGFEVIQLKECPPSDDTTQAYSLPKNASVAAAIPGKEVLVRNLEMQLVKEKDIKAALDFQVEPLLPYPAETGILQMQILKTQAKKSVLSVFSAKKDYIRGHLEELKSRFSIEPEMLTDPAIGLAAFSKAMPIPADTPIFIVYLGERESICTLVADGKVFVKRSFDSRGDLILQVRHAVLSILSEPRTKPFDSILLLGAKSHGLANEIAEATGKSVFYPSSTLLNLSQEQLQNFALAIGLAMAAEEPGTPNFRQKEFRYPYPFKKLKAPLLTLTACGIALFCLVSTIAAISITREKNRVREEYLSLLLFEDKNTSDKELPRTPAEYLEKLALLEKELKGKERSYPLTPQIPHVSDFITWISSQSKQSRGKESNFMIDHIHYTLVSYPTVSKKKQNYKVKVELSFSEEDAKAAHAIHELLTSPNNFVDAREEVTWSAARGKYRTSFYLKDKSRYG